MQPHSWFGLVFVAIGLVVFYGLFMAVHAILSGSLDGSYLVPALAAGALLVAMRKYH